MGLRRPNYDEAGHMREQAKTLEYMMTSNEPNMSWDKVLERKGPKANG